VSAFTKLTDMELRLARERAEGLFMAEGHLVIERCAELGYEIASVLTSERWLARLGSCLAQAAVPVYIADESMLREITGFRMHRGAMAAVRRPASLSVEEVLRAPGDVLVLEDLVDPTNVGLAIRSAVVQGIDGVILSPACADPLYRRAVKASMGAVLRCRWARSDDWPSSIADIRTARTLIALDPKATEGIDDALRDLAASPVALALGSEGPGLSAQVLSVARRVRIPMAGSDDSLNVAAAAAVACYARARTMSR
jgi:tRNA G18 (ribose-2'-O)-methylase SpoU